MSYTRQLPGGGPRLCISADHTVFGVSQVGAGLSCLVQNVKCNLGPAVLLVREKPDGVLKLPDEVVELPDDALLDEGRIGVPGGFVVVGFGVFWPG